MIAKFVTVPSHETVAYALDLMKREHLDAVPVLGDQGELAGLFSLSSLLRNVLPVSVTMAGGVALDLRVHAAPGVSQRLHKVLLLSVADFMEQRAATVLPETPLWEGLQALLQHNTPVLVTDGEAKVLGMITLASAIEALRRKKD